MNTKKKDRLASTAAAMGKYSMTEFEFATRTGARVKAHYHIDEGRLSVTYRDRTVSVTEGLNEIANAFLRDNLMRSILGEIEVTDHRPSEAIA